MLQSSKKTSVVVTRKLPDAIETRMMELFDTRLNAEDRPLTTGQLAEAVKTADVLVPTVTDRIDSRVLSQAGPQLRVALARQQGGQRSLRLDARAFQLLRLGRQIRAPADDPVDRHPVRDRPQPAAEALGFAQLTDLAHRLHEHLLHQFLRLGMVAQPPQRDAVHGALEPLDQLAERFLVAALGRADLGC